MEEEEKGRSTKKSLRQDRINFLFLFLLLLGRRRPPPLLSPCVYDVTLACVVGRREGGRTCQKSLLFPSPLPSASGCYEMFGFLSVPSGR